MSALRAALLAAVAMGSLSAAAIADGTDTAANSHFRVDYDQSKVIHLDRPAKTILVGNPMIADAMLVNEKTIYVQGRLFGNTNIVAIDGAGAEVLNSYVTVGTPHSAQVTVYRGAQGQRNLACSPHCERTMTQGDSEMETLYNHHDHKSDVTAKAAALSAGKN